MTTVLYDVPGPRARMRSWVGGVIAGLVIAAFLGFGLYKLNERGQLDLQRWQVFWDPPKGSTAGEVWTSLLVDGLGATLRAAGVAAVLALAFGLLLAVLRMAPTRVVRWPAIGVIELFRGIPVVLLMFFGAMALELPSFQAVVFGLAIYNGAVIGEILRAGIVSLPKGQQEAANAIGLSQPQTLFMILLPQAVRRMLPSLISQLVVLLKDTSLGFIIGYIELLRRVEHNATWFGNRHMLQLFVVAAGIYIVVNFSLSRVAVWLERRGTKKAAGGVAHADPLGIEVHDDDLTTGRK